MRKIKKVLRVYSLRLSQREIAACCAVAQATVSDHLKAAETAGLKWPVIASWSDDPVIQAVAPERPAADRRTQTPEPDYSEIHHELQTNKHATLQSM